MCNRTPHYVGYCKCRDPQDAYVREALGGMARRERKR